MPTVLEELVTMSTTLGLPENDYIILGEGNTSALMPDGTFWVKASGYQLPRIGPSGFVRVSLEKALAILEEPHLTDSAIKQRLLDAKVNPVTGQAPAPDDGIRPSTETVFHAIAFRLRAHPVLSSFTIGAFASLSAEIRAWSRLMSASSLGIFSS